MQQDTEQPVHKMPRTAIIVVGAILLTGLSFLGTVAILKRPGPATQKSVAAVTAADIIKNLSDTKDIASLSPTLYQKQTNSASSASFKLSGKPYGIRMQTKYGALYSAISKTQPDDSTAVQTQVTEFMHKLGLEKTDNPSATTAEQVRTTYSGTATMCQLDSTTLPTTTNRLRSHKISCADKTAIESEYGDIDKLLSIYTKTQKSIQPTSVSKTTKADKNIAYSTIFLSGESSQNILLFVAVDNNWEYLADLATGDSKYSNGKYIITPEAKAIINNPKYNGFIAQEIH